MEKLSIKHHQNRSENQDFYAHRSSWLIISHINILRYTLYIKRFIKADTIIFFWVVFQIFLLAQELLPEEKTILCSGFW